MTIPIEANEAPKQQVGLNSQRRLRMRFRTFALWLRSVPKDSRRIANNPTTRKIFASKQKLLLQIRKSPQLEKDFEFLLEKMDWDVDQLLQYLYWDSNMMHADPQTLIRKQKEKTWPIDRETLREIRTNIQVLTEQMERVNKTDFSPARTIILRDENDVRFNRADERYLLKAFSYLPEILRFYGQELSRKLTFSDLHWPRDIENWKSMVAHARKTSLYEQIRMKTGQYHVVRLHRLVSISRLVQGLPPISQRSFIVWLNRLKKRHERMSVRPTPPVTSEGSHPTVFL